MLKMIAKTLLALPFLISQNLLAQSLQSTVPVEKEPRHRVVFQNEHIRIYDAEIPPGDITLFHTHSYDSVFIVAGGGSGMDERLGASPLSYHVNKGVTGYNIGKDEPYTHRLKNIGKTQLRFIATEIIRDSLFSDPPSSLENLAMHNLEIENERVKVYRICISPNQFTAERPRNLPWLRVSLSESDILIHAPGKNPEHIKTKTGDFRWHDGPTIDSLRNVGKTPYEAIEIEVK